jgi:spore maturation protein CgeB
VTHRIALFVHSLRSCWNHGNAHFLRGIARELIARGHSVRALEPADGWSFANLAADHGAVGTSAFAEIYPELTPEIYDSVEEAAEAAQSADVVIVHEWNDPALVATLGALRAASARFLLLFHDTHHRAVTDPQAIRAFDLSAYDGVLAFGEALAERYRQWGWGDRVFTWHEAADTTVFRPPATPQPREGVVWIGNWGDGERTDALREFVFDPVRDTGLPLDVYGVRYPDDARALLGARGARFHGWLANARAPDVFARHLATVHVPRRAYATALPGIPTIRIFEALACGIPLISAPWHDAEGLFRDGDFLRARNGVEMGRHLAALRDDRSFRAALVESGLATIRARHTCAHRVDELLGIVRMFRESPALAAL